MSSSDLSAPLGTVSITLRGADPFTELRLLDAGFASVRLPANTGTTSVQVPPGLYEAGFRSAGGWVCSNIIAVAGSEAIEVSEPPRAEACPPAGGGAQRHDAATIIVRLRHEVADPGEGIGAILVDADDGSTIAPDLVPGDHLSWRFAVPDGFWRLQLGGAGGRPFCELPLTVSPGYRLEILVPRAPGTAMNIDLDRLRIRMVPRDMPGNDAPPALFEDVAFTALAEGRHFYGADFESLAERLTHDKAANPWLGIVAAHLCLRASKDASTPFLKTLVARLADLTGAPAALHPDVVALSLALRIAEDQSLDDVQPVPFPPLLAESWKLLLRAARRRPDLIPGGSLGQQVAGELWSSRLWVAWNRMPAEAAVPLCAPTPDPVAAALRSAGGSPALPDLGDNLRRIAGGLSHGDLREFFRSARSTGPSERVARGSADPGIVTPPEAAVASMLFPVAESEQSQSRLSDLAATLLTSDPLNATLRSMSKTLGLPPTTVQQAVGSLADKVSSWASDRKIEL